ncbi:MAG: hypothetical protein A2816_00355 [Candidatus Yanofskybacteria bacterium RIFCSPHIGHO2_01_FULL_39_44]|nr:MAG: hypothetical protein A2816_00355 [Candidatus Yanofskybacteria bacterium RIFCSPHIGHO2_01_FULL_39_44]
MKYRVLSSRWDTPEHKIDEFTEDSDEKAKEKFDKEFKKTPHLSWDDLKLIRFEEVIIETSDANGKGA